MAFDPDAYLAKKQSPKQGFDPDAYLSSKQEPEEKPLITGKGLLKSTLEALPMAGSMFGGAAGFLSPIPGGTILGAGGGAAAGKALENLGERYLLGEEKTRGQVYGEPIQAAGEGSLAEGAGMLVAPTAKAVGSAIKKTASSLTRVPEKAIDTYLKRGKDVEKLIEKHGSNTLESADAVRQEINSKVQAFKNKQNAQISKSLKDRTDIIDVTKSTKELQDAIGKFDPGFDAEKIQKIQKELDLINQEAPNGLLPIKSANALKQRLQDLSDYLEPGQYFKKKGLIDVAFEKSASNLNREITKAAPEIREANKNLQGIRRATKNLNRNLLKEGQTEASLVAASKGNDKNALALRNLSEMTGEDFIPQIENVAAQKYFADPGLLPGMDTGAAAIPLILGGAGAAYGGLVEGDLGGAGKGLLLGAAGSPLALKYGIKAARPILKGGKLVYPTLKQLPKGLLMGGGDE